MFCKKSANNRINKLHEVAPRLVYDDCKTSSRGYSQKIVHLPSIIQTENIQTLRFEMYKIKHKLSEKCLKDLFRAVIGADFRVPGINTVFTMLIQLGILDR